MTLTSNILHQAKQVEMKKLEAEWRSFDKSHKELDSRMDVIRNEKVCAGPTRNIKQIKTNQKSNALYIDQDICLYLKVSFLGTFGIGAYLVGIYDVRDVLHCYV
jgi:hypothetical protein